MSDLQHMIDAIAEKYTFTAEHYPDLAAKSKQEVFLFAVRHNVLHMGKSLGKISAFSEDTDHGEGGDRAHLEEATVKMLINTLRLAELQGLTAKKLVELVPKMMR